MILSKSTIESLIPHRPPFVMIDNLLAASEQELCSDFLILQNNVLCDTDGFTTPGLIENIAQTCAAGLGYLDSKKGEGAKLGFIGAINKLIAFANPAVGATLLTKVEILQQFENVILIKGSNYVGENLQLECEMKIVIVG